MAIRPVFLGRIANPSYKDLTNLFMRGHLVATELGPYRQLVLRSINDDAYRSEIQQRVQAADYD